MHPQHNELNICTFGSDTQTTDKNKRWHDMCTPAGTRLDLLLSLISTPDWILWLKRVWFNLYILSVSHHPGCDSHATSRSLTITNPPPVPSSSSSSSDNSNITAPWELNKIWQDQQDYQLCIWESDRGVPEQRHSEALIELQFPSTGKLDF